MRINWFLWALVIAITIIGYCVIVNAKSKIWCIFFPILAVLFIFYNILWYLIISTIFNLNSTNTDSSLFGMLELLFVIVYFMLVNEQNLNILLGIISFIVFMIANKVRRKKNMQKEHIQINKKEGV